MPASATLLRWTERVAPALARALATPAVRGAAAVRAADATEWSVGSEAQRALVLYLTASPATSRWLAGSLAMRLGAKVAVPHALDRAEAAAAALRAGSDLPLAVVGEGDGCAAAIAVARASGSRLALVSPPAIVAPPASDWPTTLIQATADGEHRAAVAALDTALRRAGVAVRETEYADVEDGWVRYPRVSRGSKHALDDLVAFLDRGIGQASTFDVIPGWDLH